MCHGCGTRYRPTEELPRELVRLQRWSVSWVAAAAGMDSIADWHAFPHVSQPLRRSSEPLFWLFNPCREATSLWLWPGLAMGVANLSLPR